MDGQTDGNGIASTAVCIASNADALYILSNSTEYRQTEGKTDRQTDMLRQIFSQMANQTNLYNKGQTKTNKRVK